MKKTLQILAAFYLLLAVGALGIWARDITVTWPISTTANTRYQPLEIYSGEDITYTHYATDSAGAAIDLSGLDVTFEVYGWGDDKTNQYLVITGSVVTATNGHVQVDLTPTEATLTPATYLGYLIAYTNTTVYNVLSSLRIEVLESPQSILYSTAPASPVSHAADPDAHHADMFQGIYTNQNPTLLTPGGVGHWYVDVGSNTTVRAFGSTTNDWRWSPTVGF